LWAGIYNQLHGIVRLGIKGHGLVKGILNPAVSGGIAKGAGAVASRVNFNFHGVIIAKNSICAKALQVI